MRSKENLLLNPDFIDILSAFSDEKVEYLVVGAFAMAFHRYLRATGDIDLWIRNSDENADKVWQALSKFAAPLSDVSKADLSTPEMVFQIGVEPNRIDILTAISSVDFNTAWNRRITFEFGSLSISVIDKTSLLQNKRATNRPKDAGDILWLESE